VSVLEPHRTRGIDHLAVAVGLFVAAGALMLALALVARAARADAEGARRPARNRLLQRASAAVPRPASADGVRAAFGQRTATLVIAGGAVVTAACVAALVFGASLTALVGTPRTYGWPWDLALMTGSGYGDLDLPQAGKVLTDDPDVAHWTTFGFLNEATLDGDPMMSVVGLERDTLDVDFPVLVGRLPIRADEVALGAVTARERGLSVGDTVRISGVAEPVEAEVTGLVVFPTLGPLFAGEVSAGTGMLLPQAMVEGGGITDITLDLATFLGIDLHDGVDAQAAQQLQDRLAGIDLQGAPARVYRTPIRPPEVIEAAATRSVPLIVGGLLVVVGGLGLAVVSWASMRTRRYDVAPGRHVGPGPVGRGRRRRPRGRRADRDRDRADQLAGLRAPARRGAGSGAGRAGHRRAGRRRARPRPGRRPAPGPQRRARPARARAPGRVSRTPDGRTSAAPRGGGTSSTP
jgi:hypothetical protein